MGLVSLASARVLLTRHEDEGIYLGIDPDTSRTSPPN